MKTGNTARYFKIETFGAVDGPGVRFVIFLQGCPLRCKYCHNPESWDLKGDSKFITVDEILKQYQKTADFYKNGGITVSGGEPMLHMDFILELAQACYQQHIHLCIDTACYFFNDQNLKMFDELIKYVSLWLIDIKHINPTKYPLVTGSTHQHELNFIKYLEQHHKPYWVRQVLVPGLTDDPTDLLTLGKFLKPLKYMLKFEILPYHDMAKPKYVNLKIKYALDKTVPPTREQIAQAMQIIKQGMSD